MSTEKHDEMADFPWLIRVGSSSIGTGVFATEEFSPEEIVGEIDGHFIEDANYGSDYCIHLEGDYSLEPAAPFCYLNHCCQPNCVLAFCWEEGEEKPTVWVEAIRPIQPEDELTIDYAWPAEMAIRCECGSPECRGWVVAEESLHEVDQTESA